MSKTTFRGAFALVLASIALTAAAAALGEPFEIERADAFEPGVTTIAAAKERLGEPTTVSTNEEGRQLLWWKYANVSLFGRDVRKLAVVFDQEGKMLRIHHREVLK